VFQVDPDRPHRFRPLRVVDRPHAKQRQWVHYNGALTDDRVPCLVCGGSMVSPVHWDVRFGSGDRAQHGA
jgi:hypothetical protein